MENRNTNKGNEFEKKAKAKAKSREKSIVTASAVFVLTALTVTGIYMNNKSSRDNLLQEETVESQQNVENIMNTPELINAGDLQSVDSGTVENPGVVNNTKKPSKIVASDTSNMLVENEETETQEVLSGEVENMMLSFNGMNMFWPIPTDNDVLIPYSMEKAVYFETLDQYKYNPAMIISAEVGTPVCAVSAGKITKRYWDYETGWTYEMDLGGGFKAYYGQLDNMQKAEDTYIVAGDVLGYVANPTKYYSKEGSNLYFAMTKDGKPVYPKEYMGE